MKLKLQYFGHLVRRADSLEKTPTLGEIAGRRRRGNRGWDGWMASPTRWTWVWASSRRWWRTGKPRVLQSMGSQRVGRDFSSAQSLSHVQLFVTPWTVAHQASLSFTNSWNLFKLKSSDPFNYLILCHTPLFLPSIFPSIRVFSNESVLRIRWPKYWSFSFSICPSNEYLGLISFRID